jgi:hypothetical protein
MSRVIKNLPEISQLKIELTDPKKLKMYSKYDAFEGSLESIQYLHQRLKVDPEPDNSYIKKRFMG